MHQRKYCLKLISDMGQSGAEPIGAPIELNQKFTSTRFDLYFPLESKIDKLLKDTTLCVRVYMYVCIYIRSWWEDFYI